ncbi:hypothetical protein MSAN_01274500 [Mycena sanguinolenta]|uniref:BRCT domain-containing protein n=1 Tax=Mycena sanguinolenta TaxID=230812 RepID=A0A8H7D563_9AGAR|nr:hypothetical protein MSAN_01274500 [Mycena sanguinolenta]
MDSSNKSTSKSTAHSPPLIPPANSFPLNPQLPLFSGVLAFGGLRVSAEVEVALNKNGAQFTTKPELASIILCADGEYHPVLAHTSFYDRLVHEDWVIACLYANKILPTRNFHPALIFCAVFLVCLGLKKKTRQALIQLLESNGGVFQKDFDPTTTHIVVDGGVTSLEEDLRQLQGLPVHIVTPRYENRAPVNNEEDPEITLAPSFNSTPPGAETHPDDLERDVPFVDLFQAETLLTQLDGPDGAALDDAPVEDVSMQPPPENAIAHDDEAANDAPVEDVSMQPPPENAIAHDDEAANDAPVEDVSMQPPPENAIAHDDEAANDAPAEELPDEDDRSTLSSLTSLESEDAHEAGSVHADAQEAARALRERPVYTFSVTGRRDDREKKFSKLRNVQYLEAGGTYYVVNELSKTPGTLRALATGQIITKYTWITASNRANMVQDPREYKMKHLYIDLANANIRDGGLFHGYTVHFVGYPATAEDSDEDVKLLAPLIKAHNGAVVYHPTRQWPPTPELLRARQLFFAAAGMQPYPAGVRVWARKRFVKAMFRGSLAS